MKPPAIPITPTTPAERGPYIDRGEGLSAGGRQVLAGVTEAIRTEDYAQAERLLSSLAALAPTHPEVLRLRGVVAYVRGRFSEAAELLRRCLEERPNDALAWNNIGSAMAELGDVESAVVAFGKCAELAPARAMVWANLGRALDLAGRAEEAHAALEKALERDPEHVPSRLTRARVLQFLGAIDEAEAEYRRLLQAHPESALAWFGLSTLRTRPFGADDVAAIEKVYARADLSSDERIGAGFALAKALEDQGRYGEAFAILTAANSEKRRRLSWDASAFTRYIDDVAAAFAKPSGPVESGKGNGIVFVFGLPRSGSTLVEQILAAHPDVTGGNELEDLDQVIEGESRRRRSPFPAWAPRASAADWNRLGDEYLSRTERFRRDRPVFTDKGLANWRYVGALRAMLPGARLVDCRRDPVETCLSCYRQLFAKPLGFAYDLTELARYWRDYDRTMRLWRERYPGAVHELVHERLIADPEAEIRALLAFCGLDFDARCLDSHAVERTVRTASAAQVREPLRGDTARSYRYGAVLDSLRRQLAPGDR